MNVLWPLSHGTRGKASLRALLQDALALAALSLASLLGSVGALGAQSTGWIVVSEPSEWSDDRTLTVASGTRVRVLGQAFHGTGIQAITVGSEAMQVRPAAGGVVDFEGYLTISPGMTDVAIEARPASGDPVLRTFTVVATGAGPAGGGERAAAPAPAAVYSPSGAMVRSLFLPGLGQMYTRRPVLGAVFIGAAVGAAGLGLFSTETTVRCLAPLTDGTCPSGAEHSREEKKPYMAAGLGGVAAVAVVAAIEAFTAAKRLNEEGGQANAGPSWRERSTPVFAVSPDGLQLGLRITR